MRCRIVVRASALTTVFTGMGRRRHAFTLALAFGSTELAFEVQVPVALSTREVAALDVLLLPLGVILRALAEVSSIRAMAASAIGGRRAAGVA